MHATVAAGGRAALASLRRCTAARRRRHAQVRVALPPRDVLRKTLVLPAAVEDNLRQALALRPRPPYAVQGRRAVFRRGRRRARSGAQRDHASTWLPRAARSSTPRSRHAARVGRERGRGRPGASGTRRTASRLNLLAARARGPSLPRGSAGSSGCRSRCSARVALVADRASAVAEARLRDRAQHARRRSARSGRGVRNAAHRARAPGAATTTSRSSASTRIPSALQVLDDVSRVLPDDTWLTQFEMKTIAKGKETQRELAGARRVGQRGPAGAAARGVDAVRADRAALADDQDPAGPRRDLRPRRAAEAIAAARAGCVAGRRQVRRDPGAATAEPPPASRAAPAAPAPRHRPARRRATRSGSCRGVPARRLHRPRRCPRAAANSCRAARRSCRPAAPTRAKPRRGVAAAAAPPATAPRFGARRRRAPRPVAARAGQSQTLPMTPPAAVKAPCRTRRQREPSHDAGVRGAPVAPAAARAGRRAAGRRRRRWRWRCCWGRSCCSTGTTTRRSPTRPTASNGIAASPRRRRSCARALEADEAKGRPPLLPQEHGAESRRRGVVGPGARRHREQRRAHHDQPEPGAARRRPLPADRSSTCSSSRPRRRWRRSLPRSTRRCPTSWSTI